MAGNNSGCAPVTLALISAFAAATDVGVGEAIGVDDGLRLIDVEGCRGLSALPIRTPR
jgi:hypothetical protein